MRHGTCFRRRLSARHAGAAPHSAVAELEVVRRLRTSPVAALIYLALILLSVLFVWACAAVFSSRQQSRTLRGLFAVIIVAAFVAAFFTTFYYDYYSNPNTRMFGWPIPRVVFQRTGPDAPWLDFVGWITFGAYPINSVLFLFVPSIIFLVLARRNRAKHEPTVA